MHIFSLLSLAAFAAWLYLAFAHGKFWRPLLPEESPTPRTFPSVDIVVPARDEAHALPRTLPSLLTQDYAGAWRVILVDDHSGDGTADIARQIAADHDQTDRLTVIAAPDLAKGWSGKVAAMNAGVLQSSADMILFTDADIRHAPRHLAHLVVRAEAGKLDLVSRMVKLNGESVAEKLLIPAFVFFFAMLYPFRRANDPNSNVAAAAGGVMLARRAMLDKIGGLTSIKSALIDDCSLAKAIKTAGGKIELTLTREAESLRSYPHVRDVWHMVARTAYTQLRHSPLLLAGTVAGMALLFLAPPLFFIFASTETPLLIGFLAWLLMTALYAPTVKFYGMLWPCALTLPVAALVYVAATVDSAWLYHRGKGGQWKGRTQSVG
ncbi:MAG: glycosyltransferase [Alphaproteobacteria bacterium]|nr:glycosyltransferase [Alphaproteobacteria bacterium]